QDGGGYSGEDVGAAGSDAESGRSRPLCELLRTDARADAGCEPQCRGAQRAVARRAHQSLFIRPESRLVRAHAVGDREPGTGTMGVVSAGVCRSARNGRRSYLLLYSGERSLQSAPDSHTAPELDAVREE